MLDRASNYAPSALREYALLNFGLDSVAEKTVALYRQALAIHRKLLGEHPDVATSLNNLAGVLLDQDKFADAEEYMREALAMRRKVLDRDHPTVAVSLHNLGAVLGRQGKFVEAEKVLMEDYQQSHESPLYKQQQLNGLVSLYEAWDAAAPGTGKSAIAEEWKRQLEALSAETRAANHGASSKQWFGTFLRLLIGSKIRPFIAI